MEEALTQPPAPLNAFTSDACILELVPAGVDKGAGLEAAANLLGIPLSETIAVGDGFNDLPMILRAGLAAPWANAPGGRAKAGPGSLSPPAATTAWRG